MKYPQNKNFISPQLSMRIQCIFFVLENDEFLNLRAIGYRQHFRKNHAKSIQDFIQFFGSFSNK
ncbi:hypothetical protein DN398_25010 [Bacillus sp. JAS102]|nr:hypothetical protein DN398_25010 [Bacillus sp. JAS102]